MTIITADQIRAIKTWARDTYREAKRNRAFQQDTRFAIIEVKTNEGLATKDSVRMFLLTLTLQRDDHGHVTGYNLRVGHRERS